MTPLRPAPSTRRAAALAALAAACALASPAAGQSLFVRPVKVALDDRGRVDPLAELRTTSYFLVEPPEPREIQKHDLVYVIVDELMRTQSRQSLETTKELLVDGRIQGALDPGQLIEGRFEPSGLTNFDLLRAQGAQEFEGEGDYLRQDQIIARLAAKVIDVKPNGTLVVEATKTLATDDEERIFVLSGICRQADVTNANTILSSQLADLRLSIHHRGELPKASSKGLVTRVVEALFNL